MILDRKAVLGSKFWFDAMRGYFRRRTKPAESNMVRGWRQGSWNRISDHSLAGSKNSSIGIHQATIRNFESEGAGALFFFGELSLLLWNCRSFLASPRSAQRVLPRIARGNYNNTYTRGSKQMVVGPMVVRMFQECPWTLGTNYQTNPKASALRNQEEAMDLDRPQLPRLLTWWE